MKRSKQLVVACSTALIGTWAVQGWAEGDTAQKRDQNRSQSQTQSNQQASQQGASGNKVSQKAGQPTNVMIVGEVTDSRNVKLASTAGDQHRLLKVKPRDGQEIIVDLGVPDSSTQTNFSKGDRIVAVGKPARINDRPVVFAASVAEMQKVGRTSSDMKTSKASTNQQQRTASASSASNQPSSQSNQQSKDGYDSVVYFFTTDNLAQDKYGPYDEDFAWETNDSAYSTWNDTADSWDQTEFAHFDMFGYDDSGEEGLWDW